MFSPAFYVTRPLRQHLFDRFHPQGRVSGLDFSRVALFGPAKIGWVAPSGPPKSIGEGGLTETPKFRSRLRLVTLGSVPVHCTCTDAERKPPLWSASRGMMERPSPQSSPVDLETGNQGCGSEDGEPQEMLRPRSCRSKVYTIFPTEG